MRIGIVGAGAVGSYYGARLAAAGHQVHFLLRSDYCEVKANGIRVQSVDGDFHIANVSGFRSSDEIGRVDLVILAWKTTSNHRIQEVLGPMVGRQTKILTLQNGLGNVEMLADLFGSSNVLGGLCFVCINRIGPGRVRHTAAGLIRLAWADRCADSYLHHLVKEFKNARIDCEAEDHLGKALWMKLVWNIPFNGLAVAEGGVSTGVLLKQKILELEIRKIMYEVVTVARALGHSLCYSMIDHQIALTRPMGDYRPSSMIDWIEGRAIEYEAIWQKPLEVAESLGVEVPKMRHLAARVQAKLNL